MDQPRFFIQRDFVFLISVACHMDSVAINSTDARGYLAISLRSGQRMKIAQRTIHVYNVVYLGGIPVEQTPQIVLLTFDDAVNDLNKPLYSDLFENERKNPNGCPITATFYVSHEWTDYSQVQNLYADGHEMASHTVS